MAEGSGAKLNLEQMGFGSAGVTLPNMEMGHVIEGNVARYEQRNAFERKSSTGKKGVVGAVENVVTWFKDYTGRGSIGQEVQSFNESVMNNDQTFLQEVDNFVGLNREEQVKRLAGGVEMISENNGGNVGFEKVVNELMDRRERGVKSPEVTKILTELKDHFVNGTKEDVAQVESYLEAARTAKTETGAAMNRMWEAQEDHDRLQRWRIDAASRQDTHAYYQDKADTDLVKRGLLYKVRSIIPGIGHKAHRVASVTRHSQKDFVEVWSDRGQADVRARALKVTDDRQDLEMWRKGIVSTQDLLDQKNEETMYTKDQLNKLGCNKDEIKWLLDRKGYKNTDTDSRSADELTQINYFEEVFAKRVTESQNAFRASRKRWLGMDLDNLQAGFDPSPYERTTYFKLHQKEFGGKKYQEVQDEILAKMRSENQNRTEGAILEQYPVPDWFKNAAFELSSAGANGVLTVGEGLDKGAEFVVENVESVIARQALEGLLGSTVGVEMASNNFAQALENADNATLLDAADIQRGAWAVKYQALLRAAGTADILAMTPDTETVGSALGMMPGEIIDASVNYITGGVKIGKNSADTIRGIIEHAKKFMRGESLGTASEKDVARQEEWFNTQVEALSIPEDFRTWEGINDRRSKGLGKVSGAVSELFDPKNMKSDFWKTVNAGSETFSVLEVMGRETKPGEEISSKGENVALLDRMAGVDAFIETSSPALTAEHDAAKKSEKALKLASSVKLRDAQQQHALEQLTQIKRRSQLDSMYEKYAAVVGITAATAVGMEVMTATRPIIEKIASQAHLSFTGALQQLQVLQNALETAGNPAHFTGSDAQLHQQWAQQAGENSVWWQQYVTTPFEAIKMGTTEVAQLGHRSVQVTEAILTGLGIAAGGGIPLWEGFGRRIVNKVVGQRNARVTSFMQQKPEQQVI